MCCVNTIHVLCAHHVCVLCRYHTCAVGGPCLFFRFFLSRPSSEGRRARGGNSRGKHHHTVCVCVWCGVAFEGLAIGITGHVGSQFNFAGDLFNELIAKFDSQGLTKASAHEIRSLQLRALDLISAWSDATPPGGYNGCKYYMNLAGVPVGAARLPSLPLHAEAKEALHTSFEAFCKASKRSTPLPSASALRMCAAP